MMATIDRNLLGSATRGEEPACSWATGGVGSPAGGGPRLKVRTFSERGSSRCSATVRWCRSLATSSRAELSSWPHLLEQPGAVAFHGPHADPQRGGDLLGTLTGDEQLRDGRARDPTTAAYAPRRRCAERGRSRSCLSISSASRMRASSTGGEVGFSRKSIAPPRRACTDVGTDPCAVKMMTGGCDGRARELVEHAPDRSRRNRMSSTMQPGSSGSNAARNSRPDAYTAARSP